MDASMSESHRLVDGTDAHILTRTYAGWGDTARLIDEAGPGRMVPLGARPSDVLAALGPTTHADHDQVGDELAHDTLGRATDQAMSHGGTGRWLFDSWAVNGHTPDRGVRRDHIVTATYGTDHERVLSDRAEHPWRNFTAIAVLHQQSPA